MADEVGKYLTMGISEGAIDEVDDAKKEINKALNKMVSQINLPSLDLNTNVSGNNPNASNSKTVNNYYNFNQTNNSPKPLDRLEIWRQSKNLLNSKGGSYV